MTAPCSGNCPPKMLAVCLYMMKGDALYLPGTGVGNDQFSGQQHRGLQDIEIHNVYREMVGSGRISHEEMIRYINHMGQDNARTPMQWDDTAQAGFTEGRPWLGVNPNYTWLNAREQAGRGDSVLSFYKQLIKLRHTMDILVYGTYRLLLEESRSVYAYERTLGDERLTVLCNFTDQTQSCGLSCRDLGTDNVLIGNYPDQSRTFRETARPCMKRRISASDPMKPLCLRNNCWRILYGHYIRRKIKAVPSVQR